MLENFEKYFRAVLDLSAAMLMDTQDLSSEEIEEIGSVIHNRIFDLDGPRVVSKEPAQKDKFIADTYFQTLSEIHVSVTAIENISIYIRRCPYNNLGISKVSYLVYHIENYLNEMYLLKNRLIQYTKIIVRAYRKSDNSKYIDDSISPLSEYVAKALKKYTNVRGSHVHRLRYSDSGLDRLNTLEIYTRSNDHFGKVVKLLFESAYKVERKKWMKIINGDLEKVHNMLDEYFKRLYLTLFEDDKIIYPSNKPWVKT